MGTKELKKYCVLNEQSLEFLKYAMANLGLSARAYDRVLKVARTIADLAGPENISSDTSPKPSNTAASTGKFGV